KADIVTNLEATRAWVLEQNEENLATARAYLEGRSPFPERAALNQLAGRFLTDFYVTVAHWVDWASQLIDHWPEDVRDAPFNIVAEGCDLANTGRPDEDELQIAHQIHLLDLRSHVLVHERLVELDREVGHGA